MMATPQMHYLAFPHAQLVYQAHNVCPVHQDIYTMAM